MIYKGLGLLSEDKDISIYEDKGDVIRTGGMVFIFFSAKNTKMGRNGHYWRNLIKIPSTIRGEPINW